MIDYLTHLAAFEATVKALDANGGAPHQAEWSATRAALNNQPGSAYLGAILDQLLERSGPVAFEHERLEGGAALYTEAVKALNSCRDLREQWDQMVRDPGSASLDGFNALVGGMEQVKKTIEELNNHFETYRMTVQPPFKHVIQHASAFDHPVSAWEWRDVMTSRRTNALIRALRANSGSSASTKAFAFGAVTGYAGNALASSYLAHSVGGPRRSHPIRDRVARYSLGAWLLEHEPGHTMSLGELRGKLSMPTAVKQQILGALASTYPTGAPATMPDLDKGYARLLQHLELLESFPRPALPADIPGDLLPRVQGSSVAGNTLDKPDDWGDPSPDPNHHLPEPAVGVGVKVKPGDCIITIIIFAIIILVILPLTIFYFVKGRFPWQSDPPANPPPGSSAQALDDFLRSEQALQFVAGLYHMENLLYEATVSSLGFFKETGFLYPDRLDLYDPVFGQFTKLPTGISAANYPHRPLSNSSSGFLEYPTSAMENPGRSPSPYPAGATPSVLLRGLLGMGLPVLGSRGAATWHELFTPPNGETPNLDLDADRGFEHRCWRVAAGGSVSTDPVPVQLLGYNDVK